MLFLLPLENRRTERPVWGELAVCKSQVCHRRCAGAVKPPPDCFGFICEPICRHVGVTHHLLSTIASDNEGMKYDGGEASSDDDANRDGPVVRQAAFISCFTSSHTSPARSGWRPEPKVMHLSPRCAIWLACTKGHSPAEVSMI